MKKTLTWKLAEQEWKYLLGGRGETCYGVVVYEPSSIFVLHNCVPLGYLFWKKT